MLLYIFAMGVLVVMKRKQRRDRLLREQFLNMPLPTVLQWKMHYFAVLYCTAQYCTTQYSTVLYGALGTGIQIFPPTWRFGRR